LSPLAGVKHKSRAIARRRNWMEIALSAREAMLGDRISSSPPPIEEGAHALLSNKAQHLNDSQEANGEITGEFIYAKDGAREYDKPRPSRLLSRP
jgi:hypothetical protein